MWHLDGNEKLPGDRYFHGITCGGSKMAISMEMEDNKRASTVLLHYRNAVIKYGCPRVLRTDAGTENVLVGKFQLIAWGMGNGEFNNLPFLVGKFTHNQRIERLWRDVREGGFQPFRDKRAEMIRSNQFDPNSNDHDWIWHTLLDPLVRFRLAEFVVAHNNHSISRTPLQIFNVDRHDQKPDAPPFLEDAMEWAAAQLGEQESDDFEIEECVLNQVIPDWYCPLQTREELDSFLQTTPVFTPQDSMRDFNDRFLQAEAFVERIVDDRQ